MTAMKEATVIRIKYDGYDLDLDQALETVLALKGFELSSLGFDLVAEQRDLIFRRGEAV